MFNAMPPPQTTFRVLPNRLNGTPQKVAEPVVSEAKQPAAKPKTSAFPIGFFPTTIQQFVRRCTEDLGYEPDFVAGSILAATSAAVGRSYSLYLRPGWVESATVWVSLIGRPGSGKSHPLRSALAPIYQRDKQHYGEYASATDEFKQWQNLAKADRESIPEPPKPTLKKHLVGSVTLEALANVIRDNHRGVLLHSDEIKGWLSNFGRYTGGSDTEFWLSFWSGNPTLVDRATKEPIRLEHPFVSVAGSVQPGVLELMFKDQTANGLIDRILFCWPDEISAKQWKNNEGDSAIFVPYNRAITKLLDERPEGSNELRFTPGAEQVFSRFYNDLQQSIQSAPTEQKQSLLSKMDIHCGRLALLLQMLRYACDEAENTHVDEVSVRGAIELARYFAKQATKVQRHLFERSPVDDLDATKKAFYEALPEVVTTESAVSLAKSPKYNISVRTVKRFLGEKKLFSKLAHGHYGKLL